MFLTSHAGRRVPAVVSGTARDAAIRWAGRVTAFSAAAMASSPLIRASGFSEMLVMPRSTRKRVNSG
jgi:hypothetical protein